MSALYLFAVGLTAAIGMFLFGGRVAAVAEPFGVTVSATGSALLCLELLIWSMVQTAHRVFFGLWIALLGGTFVAAVATILADNDTPDGQ